MKRTKATVIRITNLLALVLSLVAGILVPLGYFVLSYQYQVAVLNAEVLHEAGEATKMIGTNPGYWRFEQHRLEEFLSKRPTGEAEVRRIFDTRGTVIAQSADSLVGPLITRSHDLYDYGNTIATIEISRSLNSLVVNTFFLSLLGSVCGVLIFLLLKRFPLAALREAVESIQESERKFRIMASTAGDAILVMDRAGMITYWNSMAERMFGYALHDVQGMDMHRLIAPERYHESSSKGFERFRKTGEGPAIGKTIEFQARRKDGSEFPIEVSTSVIAISDDWHTVGIVRDVSERKRTEQEMIKLEKLESLGVLAGGLAHDFNNLLTVILGNASLAMQDSTQEGPTRRYLSSLIAASVKAQGLTRQLLTFAKGGDPMRRRQFVGKIIEDACRFALTGSNARCTISLAPDLMPAEVDEGQIGQVFHNIILNAVQAMPEGGLIHVTAENVVLTPDAFSAAAGPFIHTAVKDEGVGIAEQHLSRIFDPYFTTKEMGSGLGLATCHSIIKKHGGHIAVESTPGKGATFHLYIPASLERPAAEKAPTRVQEQGKGMILVMDNDEAFRAVVGDLLKAIGYEYSTAKDGAEALKWYETAMGSDRPFKAVIMDLTVPGGIGGKEAIKKLLAIDPDARVIVASGYSNDPVMADFRAYGFAGVLEKPFDLEKLRGALAAVLSRPGGRPASRLPDKTNPLSELRSPSDIQGSR